MITECCSYCRFQYNRDMSDFRFGYVSFPTHEEAKEAVSKTVKIFGQSLKLDFAKKKSQRKRMLMYRDGYNISIVTHSNVIVKVWSV